MLGRDNTVPGRRARACTRCTAEDSSYPSTRLVYVAWQTGR
jgi:hypothetical protein